LKRVNQMAKTNIRIGKNERVRMESWTEEERALNPDASIGDLQTKWIVRAKPQIDDTRLVLVDITDTTHIQYDDSRHLLLSENSRASKDSYNFKYIGHGCPAGINVIKTTLLEKGKVYAILMNQLHVCPKKSADFYYDQESGRAFVLNEFVVCYQKLKSAGCDMVYAFKHGINTDWISVQEIGVKDVVFLFDHFRSIFLSFKALFGDVANTKGSARVYGHLPPNFNSTNVVSRSEEMGYVGESENEVSERTKSDRANLMKLLNLRSKFGSYQFKSKQLFVDVSDSFACALEWLIINLFVKGRSGKKQVININKGSIKNEYVFDEVEMNLKASTFALFMGLELGKTASIDLRSIRFKSSLI